MNDHPYYKQLMKNTYDQYRDFDLVLQDDICLDGGFTAKNILVIDSDSEKV